MRYYKRILMIFLTISIAFTLCVEGIVLAFDVTKTQQSNESMISSSAAQMVEFSDYRLSSEQQFVSLVRVANYTHLYLQKAESVQYNRLMLYRYVNGIYGAISGHNAGVAVSTLEDDYVIRHNGTGSIKTFLTQFFMSETDLENIKNSFTSDYVGQTTYLPVRDANGKNLFVMTRYVPTIYEKPLYIFVMFHEGQLFDLSKVGDAGVGLFYNNELVASTGPYSEEELINFDSGSVPGRLECRKIASEVSGYRYVYVIIKPSPIAQSFWLALLLGFLILGILIILTIILARRMYLPVRELMDITRADANPVTDEFEFLKKTIHSLHEEVDTMPGPLEQYNELLESAFYQDLLTGPFPHNKFSDVMRRFVPSQTDGFLYAVIVRFNQNGLSQPDFSQDMVYFLKQNIDIYLRPVLADCSFGRIIDTSFDTKVLILACSDLPRISDRLNNALLDIESKHKLDFTAAIGIPVSGIQDISLSYRQALQYMNTADFLSIGAKVVSREDITPANRATVYFPLNLEQSLSSALAQGKTEAWQSIVSDIIAVNQNERDVNLPQLSLMFAACVNRIIDALNLDPTEVTGEELSPYRTFRNAETYTDLKNEANRVLEILSTYMSPEKKMNPTMVKKMLEFIDENFQNDISLIDLADHLNLSKNYVSTLFKNTVGNNFKDYLNSTRYQRACAIMEKNPNIKIKDVAAQVGCNSDILARLFIRYSGELPRDFQEKARRKST